MSGNRPDAFVATRVVTGLLLPYVVVIVSVVRLAQGDVGVGWGLVWVAVPAIHGVLMPWRLVLDHEHARVWFAFRRSSSVPRENAAVAVGPRQAYILRRDHHYSFLVPGALVHGTERVRDAAARFGYPIVPNQYASRWSRGQYPP